MSKKEPPVIVLLTVLQAAELLGTSPRTLDGWRCDGTGPPYLKLSHKVVRYVEHELLEWLASCKRNSTSEDAK